jgi:nitrate reductase assembly molybdenum cofactor insertion protein NarJ
MSPFAQGDLDVLLLRLREGRGETADSVTALLAKALDCPRESYKGVVGALLNALKKAKRRGWCVSSVLSVARRS